MAVIELQLTDQQWERARREDICPAILLEDPHALLEYPCEPVTSERDPSLFLLHFQGDEPTHYNNWALPSLRLEYVPINEGDKEGRCWMLLALLEGHADPNGADAIWPNCPLALGLPRLFRHRALLDRRRQEPPGAGEILALPHEGPSDEAERLGAAHG